MRPNLSLTLVLLVSAGCLAPASSSADAVDRVIPAPAVDTTRSEVKDSEVAVLAGGCFWGMEGVFEHVAGVKRVVSGYSGGDRATARYDLVSSERTRHAEAIEITFDPRQVSYGQLLRLYFSVAHDPTQLNRQGPDVGPSYRSQIFFASPAQERVARAYVKQLDEAGVFAKPIVTRIEPLEAFYAAEEHHQDFMVRNPRHPYVVHHDLPKLAALERLYPALYRETPASQAR